MNAIRVVVCIFENEHRSYFDTEVKMEEQNRQKFRLLEAVAASGLNIKEKKPRKKAVKREITYNSKGDRVFLDDDRVRNVCFTSWSTKPLNELKDWKYNYIVASKEFGENQIWDETKGFYEQNWHIQGYVEFKNPTLVKTIRKFDKGIHLEIRKGTPLQASDYCKKETKGILDSYAIDKDISQEELEKLREWMTFEDGEISTQGKRSDIDVLTDAIKDGKSMKEVAELNPALYVRSYKGLEAYQGLQRVKRTTKPIVIWIYGLAGTGKTRYCVDKHPDHYLKDETKWWDGYDQQEAIIIDDFDGKWPFRNFLKLTDRYGIRAEFKGSYIPINSKFIYITCEFAPCHFWQGNEFDQVVGRISYIIQATKDGYRIMEDIESAKILLSQEELSNMEMKASEERSSGLLKFTKNLSEPLKKHTEACALTAQKLANFGKLN